MKSLISKSQSAFTLVEILIVVAIIAILVGIGVPKLLTAKADAQAAKRKAVIAAVSLAKERYTLEPTFNAAAVTAFNTTASTDALKFALIKGYVNVNGATAVDLATTLDGTGFTSMTIGNCADTAGAGAGLPSIP